MSNWLFKEGGVSYFKILLFGGSYVCSVLFSLCYQFYYMILAYT